MGGGGLLKPPPPPPDRIRLRNLFNVRPAPIFQATPSPTNLEHEQRITSVMDISSREMLRNCSPQFINLLAELFTRSLIQGQLPGTWKSAKIVPTPKKQPGSYRPISPLPVQSKLMERVILQRIRWTATPPHPRAMGFKPGSGTRDAVATFIHDISESKHRSAHKQQGVAVFLDLKKAFEMGQSLMSWLPLGSAVTYSHGVATS